MQHKQLHTWAASSRRLVAQVVLFRGLNGATSEEYSTGTNLFDFNGVRIWVAVFFMVFPDEAPKQVLKFPHASVGKTCMVVLSSLALIHCTAFGRGREKPQPCNFIRKQQQTKKSFYNMTS